jgi:hypothetical protein
MSYEGKMARASLRKNIAYSTELLDMIKPEAELEPWIQDKLSQTDHHIEAIYGYYRFGEWLESPTDDEKDYGEDESEEEFYVGNYEPEYFFMCPSAMKLYRYITKIGVSEKLAQQSAQLQDVLYYTEHMAVETGLATDTDVKIAESLAEHIMMLAESMDLTKQHEYIQMHVDAIKNINSGDSEEQTMVVAFRED